MEIHERKKQWEKGRYILYADTCCGDANYSTA